MGEEGSGGSERRFAARCRCRGAGARRGSAWRPSRSRRPSDERARELRQGGEGGRDDGAAGREGASRGGSPRDASGPRCRAGRWRARPSTWTRAGEVRPRRPDPRVRSRVAAGRRGWRVVGGAPGSRGRDPPAAARFVNSYVQDELWRATARSAGEPRVARLRATGGSVRVRGRRRQAVGTNSAQA